MLKMREFIIPIHIIMEDEMSLVVAKRVVTRLSFLLTAELMSLLLEVILVSLLFY